MRTSGGRRWLKRWWFRAFFPALVHRLILPCHAVVDLFLTRERWKAEHIKSYLSDIAVDAKDLDKLLLKYARVLTDKDGSWYTARA
ncbi:hypothetical protein BGY98DRAFT_1010119 [Russula aff. rugulosa BPL654]|nr:hypothetical protein BGY98DRAFT_1010119 [Russula aff. rugulosa BPL654]